MFWTDIGKKVVSALFVLLILISGFLVFKKIGMAIDNISSQSMEVSPPSQELVVDPGKEVLVKAKIRNKSFNRVNIKVRIEDFAASGQDGQVALVDKETDSLKNWSLLSAESFSLEPNEVKEVTAMIKIPASVVGGQYGSFVFSIAGKEPSAGEASLAQEVASLFLLRVNGVVEENLVLTDFMVPKFVEHGPVPMEIKFKNSGNVHIKPFGIINVRNVFGKTVKDVVVKGETNILPGATRVVRASLDKKFLFGIYTAEALVNYGGKNSSLSSSSMFLVFPIRVVSVLLVILFFVYKMRKRLGKAVSALFGK